MLAVEDRAPGDAQPSARPSLIVHSTARSFGTGSAPGCARQTGHVCVFGSPPKPFSQPQNIFVRVFSWTWISRPMTGSHSGTREELLCLEQRDLDVAAHLEHRQILRKRAVHPDDAELVLARLEREPHVVDLTAREPSSRRGRTPKTRSTASTKSAALSTMCFNAAAPDGVESDRALERVPDAEQRVLRELRPDDLQADRQPVLRGRTGSRLRAAPPCSAGS